MTLIAVPVRLTVWSQVSLTLRVLMRLSVLLQVQIYEQFLKRLLNPLNTQYHIWGRFCEIARKIFQSVDLQNSEFSGVMLTRTFFTVRCLLDKISKLG